MAASELPARPPRMGDDGARDLWAQQRVMNFLDSFDSGPDGHPGSPDDLGADRRTTGPGSSRTTLSDALARCRSELEARVPAAITGEISIAGMASLREPIAEFASVATREQLPPERAIVMFKRMIGQLAEIERCPVEQRETLHQLLVEMAIESYFGSGGQGRAD